MFDTKIYGASEFLNPLAKSGFVLSETREELVFLGETEVLTVAYSDYELRATIRREKAVVFMAMFSYSSMLKSMILQNVRYLASTV